MRTQKEISDAIREGRSINRSFNKNIAVTTSAGVAQDLSMSSGNPAAQYYVGSIGSATALARSTDGGIDHGGEVPSGSKFIKEVTLLTATSGAAPSTIAFLDYLLFYPFNGMDAGLVALTNNVPLPRYEATEGTQIMVVEQNPYVGAAQIRIEYTNQDGVSGRTSPTMTLNSIANIGTIATMAPTTANAPGRYVPLQSGDYGVQSIDALEVVTGDVGVLCLVIVKPIATVPIYEVNTPSSFDFWMHLGQLPEVRNDAYLNAVMIPAGNATGATIYGDITTIWE